jgi:hypothetical protein
MSKLNTKRSIITLPEPLYDRLMAISQGRSFAAMVREAIIFYLAHHEKNK